VANPTQPDPPKTEKSRSNPTQPIGQPNPRTTLVCGSVASCWTASCVAYNHAQPSNSPVSGTTRVSRYQKGKTSLDFTEARDSEWQWQQLGHMQVCTLLQTENHAGTPPLSFLQAGCPSCRPTNSVRALKPFNYNYTSTCRCHTDEALEFVQNVVSLDLTERSQ